MPSAQILVVDDEPSILSTLKKVLSLEGYGVDVAGGVSVAESKLAKQTYDVVLLDVALPDGDGLALLSKLMAGTQPSTRPFKLRGSARSTFWKSHCPPTGCWWCSTTRCA
jgi:DNA-binding NtrC family response regulator